MGETRRKFDQHFKSARSGWSGRRASRSRRWPGTWDQVGDAGELGGQGPPGPVRAVMVG